MEPAAAQFAETLGAAALGAPAFPVVANASAEPVRTGDLARRLLGAQLTSPVRWVESVRRLADLAGADVTFVEIGPGNVLAGLAKRVLPGARTVSLGTAAEVKAFLEAA